MTVETPKLQPVRQKQAKSFFGLFLLLLGCAAALLQTSVSALYLFRSAGDLNHAGLLRAAIISLAMLAIGSLLRTGSAAAKALVRGRGNIAVAVSRACRTVFYCSVITTFTSLSLWHHAAQSPPLNALWWGLTLLVNAAPLLAFVYFFRAPGIRAKFGNEFGHRVGEAGLEMICRDSAVVVLLMLVSLLSVLIIFSVPTIRTFGFSFITGSEWRPNAIDQPVRTADGHLVYDDDGNQVTREIPPMFGALPVIWGTSVSSVIALVFAVPLSLGASIFLVRIATKWLIVPVSFLIEFLAAIPSIAYGIWGLFVMCPFLSGTLSLPHSLAWLIRVPVVGSLFHQAQTLSQLYEGTRQPLVYFNGLEPWLNHLFTQTPGLHWLASPSGGVTGRDMLAGGLILGIMVVPIITAISRDVLRNVPRAQLEGTVALGATWWESSKEMLKYSRSGLFGAVMLGLARAAGETMAITMVIGNNPQIKTSLFAPAQTMSSLLANEFAEAGGDLQRSALTEVALILLLMSLLFNVVARYLVVGKQSRSAAGA